MAEDPRIEAILDVLGPRDQGREHERLYIFEWGHETTPTDEEVLGLAKKILAALTPTIPVREAIVAAIGEYAVQAEGADASWRHDGQTSRAGHCAAWAEGLHCCIDSEHDDFDALVDAIAKRVEAHYGYR